MPILTNADLLSGRLQGWKRDRAFYFVPPGREFSDLGGGAARSLPPTSGPLSASSAQVPVLFTLRSMIPVGEGDGMLGRDPTSLKNCLRCQFDIEVVVHDFLARWSSNFVLVLPERAAQLLTEPPLRGSWASGSEPFFCPSSTSH